MFGKGLRLESSKQSGPSGTHLYSPLKRKNIPGYLPPGQINVFTCYFQNYQESCTKLSSELEMEKEEGKALQDCLMVSLQARKRIASHLEDQKKACGLHESTITSLNDQLGTEII